MTLTTLTLTIILPLVFAHTFGDTARRLARDGGLAFQLIAGIMIATYASCAMTGRERKSGTEAITLSKPVSPALLFLSRYAGIIAVLFLFSVSSGIAVMLADRIAEAFAPQTGSHTDLTTAANAILCILLSGLAAAVLNACHKAAFHSTAFCILPILLTATAVLTGFYDRAGNRTVGFAFTLDPEILLAALLVAIALLMFCALALVFSIRFEPITVTSFCVVILATGLISEWLISEKCGNAPVVVRGFLALLPDWQRFWLAGTNIPAPLLITTALYASLYTAAILTVGCILFERSEHGE